MSARREFRVDYLGEIHTDPSRTDGVLARIDENTGFLHADARLTRTGVFEYGDREGNRWGELRTAEEVFDTASMRSFEMVVVTDEHPANFVSTQNVADVQKGHAGNNVRRDGDFMVASITITDADLIERIRKGKQELSCGYWATVIADEGEADGLSYRGKHTNIRGNHVAVVDRGRAGPECRLLVDGSEIFASSPTPAPETPAPTAATASETESPAPHKDGQTPKGPTMQLEDRDGKLVLVIDGKDHPVPEEIRAQLAPKQDTPDTPADTPDTEELQAKIDAMPDMINARVALVRDAETVLGAVDLKKSDREIKTEVVKTVLDTEIEDDATDGFVEGLYQAALKTAEKARIDELESLGGGPTLHTDGELEKLDAKFHALQTGKA